MNPLKKIPQTWLLVLLISVAIPAGLPAQPLQEYQALAASRNPGVQATFSQYMAALEKAPQVGSLPDPSIAFAWFVQPVETRLGPQRFTASVSQMFPWFGTLAARREAATQMAEARYQEFVDARNKVFFEVAATYYQWYVVEQSIRITGENLELLESFRQMSTTRFETGKAKFVDVLRVEMEQEELRTQLELLQNNRQPLQARFAELLDTANLAPPNFPDSLDVPAINTNRQQLLDSIYEGNPRLERLAEERAAFITQQQAARKMGMPSFSLGLGYINIAPRTDMEVPGSGKDALLFPQIGITLPIYRGKYKAMQEEAALLQQSAELKADHLQNQLQTTLDETLRDYADAEREVQAYRKLYRLARQSRSLLVTDYTTASGQFEELLRMERKELQYKLAVEKAKATLATRAAYLHYLIGH